MADKVEIPRLDASFSAEIISESIMDTFIQLGCRVLLRTFFKIKKHGWQAQSNAISSPRLTPLIIFTYM